MVLGFVSCGLATCVILLELRVIRHLLESTKRLVTIVESTPTIEGGQGARPSSSPSALRVGSRVGLFRRRAFATRPRVGRHRPGSV